LSWRKFGFEAPELASFGDARLTGRLAYLATIRADGAPRVHPVSPFISGNTLFVYMEPASPKGKDLRSDGRYALHCSVEDATGGGGEFCVRGTASVVDDPNARIKAFDAARTIGYKPDDRYVVFELDIEEALATIYEEGLPVRSDLVTGRAVLERTVVHIPDVIALPESEFATAKQYAERFNYRTNVAVPLMREGLTLGVIAVYRAEAAAFTTKEIGLLQTFANQAVIAIENARLFNELQERLEQQTATSEILRVISRSQRDVQPVFEAIAADAQKLCGSTNCGVFTFDGELIHLVAVTSVSQEGLDAARQAFPMPPNRGSTTARAIQSRAIEYAKDVFEDPEYKLQDMARAIGFRSALCVPMLLDGKPIGAINVTGAQPAMFNDRQIAMLQTFADQAVIAIQNTRLFNELEQRNRDLTESLEQQTATSQILRVISSSPRNLAPVFDAILTNALALCEAHFGTLYLYDAGVCNAVAMRGVSGDVAQYFSRLVRPSPST